MCPRPMELATALCAGRRICHSLLRPELCTSRKAPQGVTDWRGQRYQLGLPPGPPQPQKPQTLVVELLLILLARRATSKGRRGVSPFLRRDEVTKLGFHRPCPSCALNAISSSVQAAPLGAGQMTGSCEALPWKPSRRWPRGPPRRVVVFAQSSQR